MKTARKHPSRRTLREWLWEVIWSRLWPPLRKSFDRVPGCEEILCTGTGGTHAHRSCNNCGTLTCRRSLLVDPKTLRRRLITLCGNCQIATPAKYERARRERALRDWEATTTPINHDRIMVNAMGDQFPGPVREALRAFKDSDASEATVPGIGAQSLNSSLASLGLDDSYYAETRGKQTVLRKIGQEHL